MTDTDLFLICPVCGMRISVVYGEHQRRPTELDTGHVQSKCPLDGATLIRVVNPTFDDVWDLENTVDYTISRNHDLLAETEKFDKRNKKQIAGMLNEARQLAEEEAALKHPEVAAE